MRYLFLLHVCSQLTNGAVGITHRDVVRCGELVMGAPRSYEELPYHDDVDWSARTAAEQPPVPSQPAGSHGTESRENQKTRTPVLLRLS